MDARWACVHKKHLCRRNVTMPSNYGPTAELLAVLRLSIS